MRLLTPRLSVSRAGAASAAALCACVVPAICADVQSPVAVGIHLRVDPATASRRVTERLKDEAEAIWGAYGVRIEWTEASSNDFDAHSVSLEASLERHFEDPRRTPWPPVLGLAVVNPDARSGTPIRVSFDATEGVLALRRSIRPSMAGIVVDQELSRALGRVLAHEIGHVLLGAPDHKRAGLMRAAFRAEELGEVNRAPFRLTCDEVGRLGPRLRVLAHNAQFVRLQDSTTLDVDTLRTWPERSRGEPCMAVQTAR
jgi:hypothetical protein